MKQASQRAVRLVDAGEVSALRSQALYHGVAHAFAEDTPDTVVLCTPREPYVCIGFHQDLEAELDLEFCARRGLPVVRREVGGGAVYLDQDQLFVQWIHGAASLPAGLSRRFERFVAPLAATYRELGIEAVFRPVNDLHVDGRKICGTGAARLGDAEVLVGNFLFDFDHSTMAGILRVPSEAFRAEVARSLLRYLTTIRAELGSVPDHETVKARYRRHCEQALGRPLVDGELCPEEWAAVEEVERRFASEAFLHAEGGLRRPGVKIHEDVWVKECVHAAGASRIRVTARIHAGRLEEVRIGGEGALPPAAWRGGLEAALRGVELRSRAVEEVVLEYHRRHAPAAPTKAGDWVAAVLRLEDQSGGPEGRGRSGRAWTANEEEPE